MRPQQQRVHCAVDIKHRKLPGVAKREATDFRARAGPAACWPNVSCTLAASQSAQQPHTLRLRCLCARGRLSERAVR